MHQVGQVFSRVAAQGARQQAGLNVRQQAERYGLAQQRMGEVFLFAFLVGDDHGFPRIAFEEDGAAFTFQGSDIADARAVVDLAAEGRLRVDVAPYSLDDVVDAYGALDRGGLAGRIVVRP